jgi:Domain of unknown function (DUF3291)
LQQPPDHHLAQLNIGRIRYEIDDPRMADFTNNLALVNGIAERSAGFIWRYIDDSGNATNTRPYDDPRIIVNFSVWESVDALERFVWQTVHKRFYGRRTDWFEHFEGPSGGKEVARGVPSRSYENHETGRLPFASAASVSTTQGARCSAST